MSGESFPYNDQYNERKMARVAIALGANVGDRTAHLAAGREGLAVRGVIWNAASSLYETAPVGPVRDQPAFLNQVAIGETELAPRALLEACLAVEQAAGRRRTQRWGPRTLDLDILLYDDRQIDEPGLVVPHPEMLRRAFVLVPLAEVAPDWAIPGDGRTPRALRAGLMDHEEVRLWRSSATKPPT